MIGEAIGELHRARRRRAHPHVEGAQSPINRNASNGCKIMPCDWRIVRARAQRASSRAKQSAPAMTSECPFRYLVAECMTTSAPSAIGRVKTGVAQVEFDREDRARRMSGARRALDVAHTP